LFKFVVEDFYFAKILKTSMTIMEKGAEEVMKLDALKKQVVRDEDYDSAARYKACTPHDNFFIFLSFTSYCFNYSNPLPPPHIFRAKSRQ